MRFADVTSRLLRRLILPGAAIAAVLVWLRFQFPGYLSHFFDAIPGEVWGDPTVVGGEGRHYYGGDQVQILYLAWKLKQNLAHGWSVMTDHFTFAARTGLHHDLCIGPQFWLIAIVSLFVGDIGGYNFGFVALPLALTFLASYYLCGAATRSVWVRALLAAGLTIVPLRIVELMMGHSTGSISWAVPLYWGVVLRRRMETGGRHGDAVAGAILLTTVIAEEHQGLYLLISSAMVFLVWVVQDLWPLPRAHQALWRMIVRWKYLLAGVVAVGAWGLYYRHAILTDASGQPRFARPAWDIKLYSQPLSHFVGVDGESNIGAWLVRALPLGALVLLAVVPKRLRILRSPYLAFAVAFPILLVLALGLGADWSQNSGIYEWFYTHVPFFAAQRVPIKIFTVVSTFLALLMAALYEAIAGRWRAARPEPLGPRRLALGLALALMLGAIVLQPAQYASNIRSRWPGLALTDMRWGPRHLFFYLRTHLASSDIVLTVPFDIKKGRWETYPDYLAFRSHVRFADGYFGMHPAYFEKLSPIISRFNDGAPDAGTVAEAKRLGYSYLLLNQDQWPLRTPAFAVQASFDRADWLERIQCEGGFCLYAFK
jgi:hypothetical protein